MSDRNGLFTGSFDPITIGHVQLIERASRLFDRVYVGIFYNPEKVGLFSIEQRVRMVKGALAHLENVEIVTSTQELAVTVARNLGVITLVRGCAMHRIWSTKPIWIILITSWRLNWRLFISMPSLLTRPLVRRVFESCWLFSRISHLCTRECNGGNQR